MAKISPKRKASSGERLRASPNFALAFSMDGRPYVAKEVEPYIQYWLNERYRVLLALFSGRSGATPADAVKAYFRFTKARDTKPERARLLKAIAAKRRRNASRYRRGGRRQARGAPGPPAERRDRPGLTFARRPDPIAGQQLQWCRWTCRRHWSGIPAPLWAQKGTTTRKQSPRSLGATNLR